MIADLLFIPVMTYISLAFVAYTSRCVPGCGSILYRVFALHTAFCLYFCTFFTLNSDAGHYYTVAATYTGNLRDLNLPGTKFISLICYPFANTLGLSYLSVSLVFNLFGFAGLCYFYRSVYEQVRGSRRALRYLNAFLFLPGLSFWTCSVGKDSLIFLGVGLLMFSLSKLKKRVVPFVFSLAVMFVARPQIFILAICALAVAMLVSKKALSYRNLLLVGCMLFVGYSTKDAILARFGADKITSTVALQEYLDTRASYNLDGGSSVDISQYGFFMKSFTYLYRPLFFDAKSVTMLASSLENFIYLCLTLHLLYRLPLLKVLKERSNYLNFGIVYFFLLLFVLATTTANLGIAVRQKTMFTPVLLAVYCLASARAGAVVPRKRKIRIKKIAQALAGGDSIPKEVTA